MGIYNKIERCLHYVCIAILCLSLNTASAVTISQSGDANWIPAPGETVWSTGINTYPGDGVTLIPDTEQIDISNNSVITLDSAIVNSGGNKLRVLNGSILNLATGASVTGFDNTIEIQAGGTARITGGTLSPPLSKAITVDGTLEIASGLVSSSNGNVQARNNATLIVSNGALIAKTLELGRATDAAETAMLFVFGSLGSISSESDLDLYAHNTTDTGVRVLDFTFDSMGVSPVNANANVKLTPDYGTSRLDIDLNGYASDGLLPITLLKADADDNGSGSLSGTFNETNIIDGVDTLTLAADPANMVVGEYYLEYVTGVGGSVKLYAKTREETIGPIMIERATNNTYVLISWTGVVGNTYTLQACTNLIEGAWENVMTNIYRDGSE